MFIQTESTSSEYCSDAVNYVNDNLHDNQFDVSRYSVSGQEIKKNFQVVLNDDQKCDLDTQMNLRNHLRIYLALFRWKSRAQKLYVVCKRAMNARNRFNNEFCNNIRVYCNSYSNS